MKPSMILSIASLALLALPAAAQDKPQEKPAGGYGTPKAKEASAQPASAAIVTAQRPSYPLTTCVVCGKPLPETTVDYVKDGRLYRLDAEACKAKVDAEAATLAKKIEEAVVSQQKASYPMKASPVSDKPLEATAVDHVHGTRLVRLASKEEVAAFEADPEKAMAKLDKAYIDAQLPSYPLKTCPVSKEPLDSMGEPVNRLYGTKLVRFCCKNCIPKFEKSPDTYLKAIAAAK